MLTRLKVSGFKNLVDVDVRFGPFTCIAGPNGSGKSNLFDAIHFLSMLADRPLIDAALSVRSERGRTADIRSLFHRVGDQYAETMTFEAEMIVPLEAQDDRGQQAKASITFLRYSLILAYREDEGRFSLGSLEVVQEQLTHITKGEAWKHLLFPHKAATWRRTAVQGQRRVPYFISTEGEGTDREIKLHQDGGSRGRPITLPAINLPRTVLSTSNAAESPTALVAQREMQSWRLLQLEPSSLRQPDEFAASPRLGSDGSHLPATMFRLGRTRSTQGNHVGKETSRFYSQVANRLAELIDDVHDLWVERDEKRELLTLYVRSRDGTPHPARALSDGTLRFLALAVLEFDRESQGLLCLEEPENGVHPARIPVMLKLLQDIATDTEEPVGPDNPLRQVIVNTHSPEVVKQVPDDSLLITELRETVLGDRIFKRVYLSSLPSTWRAEHGGHVMSKGKLLAYLNPAMPEASESGLNGQKVRRVMDRPDLQLLLPFSGTAR
jgi:predicted ATPase